MYVIEHSRHRKVANFVVNHRNPLPVLLASLFSSF